MFTIVICPQKQLTCCYAARYYLKDSTSAGGLKVMPIKLEDGGEAELILNFYKNGKSYRCFAYFSDLPL